MPIETVPKVDNWQAVLDAFEVMGIIHHRVALVLHRMHVSVAATGEWRLLELCDRGAVIELDKFLGIKLPRTVVIGIKDLLQANEQLEADYVAWFRSGVTGERRSETQALPRLTFGEDSRAILVED